LVLTDAGIRSNLIEINRFAAAVTTSWLAPPELFFTQNGVAPQLPPPPQVLQDSFYVDAGHPDSLAAAATVTHHRRSHLTIATPDR
jgi:hypothetical protein